MANELLMIVPTRGRPTNAVDLVDSWMQTSAGAADLCFVLDVDDPKAYNYYQRIGGIKDVRLMKVESTGMVAALNTAAVRFAHEYPVLGFMGDDHRPRTIGWDRQLVEAIAGHTVAVAYGNDLLQGEAMCTAVAMTSSIVRELGYMAPPQFHHLCIDLVWRDWGQRLGALEYLPDVVIEHMHPANGKADNDAGYERVNAPEVVSQDSKAYYAYREGGGLAADVAKLRALL